MRILLAIFLTAATGHTSLFGEVPPGQFGYCLLFAILGSYLSVQLQANKRDVDSTRTPEKFSYKFFIRDNWQRFLKNFLFIYIIVRFYPDIVRVLNLPEGMFGDRLNEFGAFLVGMGFDRILIGIYSLKEKLGGPKKDD